MYKTLLVLGVFITTNVFCQAYKKDTRPQAEKEDTYNSYQANDITKTDMLKALELAGVRVFKFQLSPFNKQYKLTVSIDEYVNGQKTSTKDLYAIGKNTYTHFEDTTLFFDYIDELTFYTKTYNDSSVFLQLETYAGTDGIKLTTSKTRKYQFYNWRRFSKTSWQLNKTIPLLVCASSWYAAENNVERFCGVVDLSRDEKETNELLQKSPHYYMISYKVSE